MAAAVASECRNPTNVGEVKEAPVNIPEIIEEQRKEKDGKTVTVRYIRGKLLGKVSTKFAVAVDRLTSG